MHKASAGYGKIRECRAYSPKDIRQQYDQMLREIGQFAELHHRWPALRDQFCAFRVEASVTVAADHGLAPKELFERIADEALFGLADIGSRRNNALDIACKEVAYRDWIAQLLHAMRAAESQGLHPFEMSVRLARGPAQRL